MILIILPDLPAEDTLLEQARQGDQDAMREIYESYFSPIYQFIRLRVEDASTAKDLAGNVFLKFIRAVREHKAPRHSLRGWLFRVARHEVYDHYGRREQFSTATLEEWLPAPQETEPEAEFIRGLNIERAREALRQLSFEQQEVILLRFGHMLSVQETADIMGKNVNTVKSHQLRALNTLRRILEAMRAQDG